VKPTHREEANMKDSELIAIAIAFAVKRHKLRSDSILAIDIRKRVITKVHLYLKGSPIKVVVEFDNNNQPARSYIEELALPIIMP